MATAFRESSARCGSALLFGVLALVPSVAAADSNAQPDASTQELKQLSLEQLGNIEVTSVTKAPESVWNTPAAIYVITQEDIQRSGATNIPEALRLAPGVEVARINGDTWAIGIRGFGTRLSRSVLVLIDGRSVYSPLLTGVYWEVQDTLMEDIDRIEVIRGPGGTIWGPNAVNGVINIITKSSKDTQGGLVAGGGGNVQRGFGEARYGASAGKDFTYRVYGKGFGWEPQYHPDGHNYDAWQAGQAGFRMDWRRNTRDSFTLQGDIYNQDLGESVSVTTYEPPQTLIQDGYGSLSGGNLLWRWRRTQGEKKDIQVDAYYARDNRHELNFGDLRDTCDGDYLQRAPLKRQELSWGASVDVSHGHNPMVVSGLVFLPGTRTDWLYTGFIQDEIAIKPEKVALFVGTKVLQTNYTGFDWEPSVRFLYTPTKTQTLWAAFTSAVRTPADVERAFYLSSRLGTAPNGLPFFARFNANPNFVSEDLNGYEIGYRRTVGGKLYVDIATFFNQYANLFSEELTSDIHFEDNPPPPHEIITAQFGNGYKGTTEGGEIVAQWQPNPWVRLSGSYSFLEMHIKIANNSATNVGSPLTTQGSSPQHQVLAQAWFNLPKAVTLDPQVRYVSSLPGLDIPAYVTGDITLGWNPTRQLLLQVVGKSLFQPWHYEFSYDPRGPVGIRRSIFAKIEWRWGMPNRASGVSQ
jgi:iron complex outermembrane receptor protein